MYPLETPIVSTKGYKQESNGLHRKVLRKRIAQNVQSKENYEGIACCKG